MKHRAVLQQQFKQKQKQTENKSKCFDMKFIVIVIDEDYTSLRRKKRKQIENKTKRRHKIIKSEKIRRRKKLVINNSECIIGHTKTPFRYLPHNCLSKRRTHTQKYTNTHTNNKNKTQKKIKWCTIRSQYYARRSDQFCSVTVSSDSCDILLPLLPKQRGFPPPLKTFLSFSLLLCFNPLLCFSENRNRNKKPLSK